MKALLIASIALVAPTLVACGPIEMMGSRGASYPSQDCVERSLRHAPPQDVLPEARAHFASECENDNVAACSTLGLMNELGLGGATDGKRALVLYDRACRHGNPEGCVNLGQAFLRGVGAERDPGRAVMALSASCHHAHAPACGALGSMYQHGDGVALDPNRATALFRRGCDGGHMGSCVELGTMLEHGERLDNMVERISLYERACAGGEQLGCERLEALYVDARRRVHITPIPSVSRR